MFKFKNYWMVGRTLFNKNGQAVNLSEEFIKKNYWEGYERVTVKEAKVEIGDIFIMKTSGGQGYLTTIEAVGFVTDTKLTEDARWRHYHMNVNWIKANLPNREAMDYTKTIERLRNESDFNFIFSQIQLK